MNQQNSKREVSVAIISHNYGCFLPGAIQSVLGQSIQPLEILVVDDSSSDDTEVVAGRFSDRGIGYLRVEFQNTLLSRRAAAEHIKGDILCFVDADDLIDPYYLEDGLKCFEVDTRIGIVYSDVEYFGEKEGITNYPESSEDSDIMADNYIHAGALVRRDALDVSEAFMHAGSINRHEDWSTWRKILKMGFRAVKQKRLYYYRKHPGSISRTRHYNLENYSYYEGAALSEEEITILTILSGREDSWNRFRNFLEKQLWNHAKVYLLLMDTSNNKFFSDKVRAWLSTSDYVSSQYVRFEIPEFQLDKDSTQSKVSEVVQDETSKRQFIMPRLYNRVKTMIGTSYVWFIAEDVIPPLDACDKMFRSFCPATVSVSAALLNHGKKSYRAWDKEYTLLGKGEGVRKVKGNGFGCVLFRSEVIRKGVFTSTKEFPDFEMGFYDTLEKKQLRKIDWGIECEQISLMNDMPTMKFTSQGESFEFIEEEEFDEEYYLENNPEVRRAVKEGGFVNGYEHYRLYGWQKGCACRKERNLKQEVEVNNSQSPLEILLKLQ